MKNCVGVESRGRGAGPVLPWHTLRPPPFPTPGQVWVTYVVFGCCRASTTARANMLTQIVPNSSSLYTLFNSFIHNSVREIQIGWPRFLNLINWGGGDPLRTLSRRTVQLGYNEAVYERFPFPKLIRYTQATLNLLNLLSVCAYREVGWAGADLLQPAPAGGGGGAGPDTSTHRQGGRYDSQYQVG